MLKHFPDILRQPLFCVYISSVKASRTLLETILIPLSVTMQRAQNIFFPNLHYKVSLVMLNPRRSALSEWAILPHKIFCVAALGDNAAIFRRMARELRSQMGLPV